MHIGENNLFQFNECIKRSTTLVCISSFLISMLCVITQKKIVLIIYLYIHYRMYMLMVISFFKSWVLYETENSSIIWNSLLTNIAIS